MPRRPRRAARRARDEDAASTEHARRLSAELNRIILRCLGRKPAERYPDVRELARDLEQLLDGGDERTLVKQITTARMDVPVIEEPTLLNASPKFIPSSTLPGVGPPKKKR